MNNSLTNIDIEKILKKLNIKINGIYSKDEIKPNERGFYIINLDDSTGPGTHWTALFKVDHSFSIYFDSYGFPAPEDIEDYLNEYSYCSKQIQNLYSSSCGFYVIGFIKFMSNTSNKDNDQENTFKRFLAKFGKNTKENESILYDILYG